MSRTRVVILTDSSRHIVEESLFPMARHLCANALIDDVYVIDRADPENAGFYNDLDPAFTQFYARKIDAEYDLGPEKEGRYVAQVMRADEFDGLWIRLDHPVSNEFLRYARALLPDHFFVNDPDGLIHTMSKVFLPELAKGLGDLLPKLKLCTMADEVEGFMDSCPEGIVLKQVLSSGGKGVARYRKNGADTELHNKNDVTKYLAAYGDCLAMEFLNPPVPQSDNRVIIMQGEVLAVVKRMPEEGGWLCNLSSGGSAVMAEITPRDIEIAKRLDPWMRREGVFLYGADMLLNSQGERVLSEINTLNVGGIYESELFTGKPFSKIIADNLAAVFAARSLG